MVILSAMFLHVLINTIIMILHNETATVSASNFRASAAAAAALGGGQSESMGPTRPGPVLLNRAEPAEPSDVPPPVRHPSPGQSKGTGWTELARAAQPPPPCCFAPALPCRREKKVGKGAASPVLPNPIVAPFPVDWQD